MKHFPTIPNGPDIALHAIGFGLAGVSIAFAGYMAAYGGGEVRVFGMEHLAIFAKPRGQAAVASAPAPSPARATAIDLTATGSVADGASRPEHSPAPQMIAARSDRAWLRMGGKIVAAEPGEEIPGVGRLSAIVRRDGGWVLLGDQGKILLTLAGGANGAELFSRRLIFD